jgi:hypothetical protein
VSAFIADRPGSGEATSDTSAGQAVTTGRPDA